MRCEGLSFKGYSLGTASRFFQNMRWAVSRPSRLQKFWIYLFLHITIVRVANAFPKEGSQAWCGPGGKPTDWLIIVDHDETPYRMWWMSSWDNSRSPEFLCLTPQGPDEPSTLGCYCEDFGADLICPDRPGWFDWNKAIQDYCQGHCRCVWYCSGTQALS